MPTEIYIAIIVFCLCIVVLTASLLIAAVYFKARINSMEKQVTQLEGDLSGLMSESQGLVSKMQQVASRATGAMDEVEQMKRTTGGWPDRAGRIFDAVAALVEPRPDAVLRPTGLGNGFLRVVMQVLLTQGNKG